jgi:protein gp37
MQRTRIEWADYTANPIKAFRIKAGDGRHGVRGHYCTKVSAGCRNCYSERMNRWVGNGLAYTAENAERVAFGLDGDEIRRIVKARIPAGSRVFLCDMTDLFHERISDTLRDTVLAAVGLRSDLTFMVLTKRPGRARAYLNDAISGCRSAMLDAAKDLTSEPIMLGAWPLPNLWLGFSAENQAALEARAPDALATPAALHFVSYEPALGPVELSPWLGPVHADAIGADYVREPVPAFAMGDSTFASAEEHPWHRGIEWVIAGGETGTAARPPHPNWFRSVCRQCDAARVPFFLKSWGEWRPVRQDDPFPQKGKFPKAHFLGTDGQFAEFPSADAVLVARLGRKRTGAALDGVTYHELPRDVGTPEKRP